MIDYLSPREYEEVVRAEAAGRGWARALRCFLDGPRLRLGWDHGLAEEEIARRAAIEWPGLRAAIDEAVRFCVERKLHLLGWQEENGSWTYFMAVG